MVSAVQRPRPTWIRVPTIARTMLYRNPSASMSKQINGGSVERNDRASLNALSLFGNRLTGPSVKLIQASQPAMRETSARKTVLTLEERLGHWVSKQRK